MGRVKNLRKLEPFTQVRKYITEESVQSGEPIYIIEPEFMKWVILHAEMFIERYQKANPNKHWTQNERANTRLGLCGQKAFEMLLQFLNCFYIPNDPILPREQQKPYDFSVSHLGTVEVKTEYWKSQKVIVKAKEWHGNDYLVAWKMDEKQEKW